MFVSIFHYSNFTYSFCFIEGEIAKLEVDMGVGAFMSERDDHLKDIMHQKQLILTHKEEYLL